MLPYALTFAAGLATGLAGWWTSHRHLAAVAAQKDDHEARAEAFWEAAMAADYRAMIAARWRRLYHRARNPRPVPLP